MDRLNLICPGTAIAGPEYWAFRSGPLASTVVEAGTTSVRPGYGATLNSYFVRPSSRVTVRVASADPNEAPLIDPNFLADDRDLEMAFAGVKQSRQIMEQASMARYVKKAHVGDGARVKPKDAES